MNTDKHKLKPYEINERQKYLEQLNSLAIEISNSMKGFANLRQKYKDDASFTAKLDIIISKLESSERRCRKVLSMIDERFKEKLTNKDHKRWLCW